MSRSRILIAIGLIALVITALLIWRPWAPSPPTPTTAPHALRTGYLPIAAGLPLFVAIEEGYLRDAGFDVQLTRFASSNELASAGSAGRLDVLMPCALNVLFDIGIVSGQHHLLFGVNEYSDQEPHIVDYLVARTGSDITSLDDVRGRKVGAFPGSVTRIFVQSILRDHGIEPSEYTYLEISPQNWQPSLQSGAIDVASVMEPQASQIISDGVAKILVAGFFARLMPDVPLSGHWLTERFAESTDPSRVAALVSAYDRAVAFIRAKPDEAKAHYLKYVGVRSELLPGLQLNNWQTSSELDIESIQRFADILANDGGIQGRVNVQDFVYVGEE